MPAFYSNKFVVEINDVARVVFVDERAPIAEGMPMSSQTATEIVMTHSNFIALADALNTIAAKLKAGK